MDTRGRSAGAMALALAAALASGCALVQSRHENTGEPRRGLAYMLPKALLPVQLVEADGVLMLRVMPPVTVGDPAQRYLLAHGASVLSSDDVKIEVDAATGLLSKITASAEDQTLAVLGELVRIGAARRGEGGDGGGGETVLVSGLLDPDRGATAAAANGELLGAIEAALAARVAAKHDACVSGAGADCDAVRALHARLSAPGRAPGSVVVVRAEASEEAGSSGRAATAGTPATATTASSAAQAATATAASAAAATAPPAAASPDAARAPGAPAARCDEGICHRALRPFVVELRIEGLQHQSTVVQLPNGGAPIALPLDRAPFVKTEYTVEFAGGLLQSVHTKKPSSALALVKWPLDLYRSVLEATSTLIQLRIGASEKEVELAQRQLETERELRRIRDERRDLDGESGTPRPGATRLGGPRRGDALLAVELGARPQLQLVPPRAAPAAALPASAATSARRPGDPHP